MLLILLALSSLCTIHGLLIPPRIFGIHLNTIPFTLQDFSSSKQTPLASHESYTMNQKKPRIAVSVTLGVMSRCPDAQICESVFDKVFARTGNLIDLKTVYIGSLNESSPPYGVDCKHGGQECDGNVQQLCVRDNVDSQEMWWDFIQCQNFGDIGRVGDVSLATKCSKLIQKDWDTDFAACYKGSQGLQLLQASVKEATSMNITKSCSIYVNQRLVCVHDGGWQNCQMGHEPSDFERLIRKEFDAINGL